VGKTGPKCTVCASEHRHRIEIGLVSGCSARFLADKFGLSKDSISRHQANHLTPAIRAGILAARKPSEIDLEALRADESAGLISQLVSQRARLHQHGDVAMSLGDVRACVSVESAITANLTLVGRLLGQLAVQHSVTHTSVLISQDWLRVRAALVAALRPFPEAARAVGAALHRLEAEAAKDITAAASRGRARPEPALIEHEAAPPAPPPPPCPVPPPC
jgi:hypothetical protein